MKIIAFLLSILMSVGTFAQKQIVIEHCNLLKKFLSGADVMEKLANTFYSGNTKIDNFIVDYNDFGFKQAGLSDITADSYVLVFLNYCNKASYNYVNMSEENYKYQIPIDSQHFVPHYIVVDYKFQDQYNLVKGSDIFVVSNNKIIKVIEKNKTAVRAMELYAMKRYDEAFRLFDKLAQDPKNYFAQYSKAVMEIKKQGCRNKADRKTDCAQILLAAHNAYKSGQTNDPFAQKLDELYYRYVRI